MARVTARLRPVLVAAASSETASATAAITVAAHVRKSLADTSLPVACFSHALMSSERRSAQRRPRL